MNRALLLAALGLVILPATSRAQERGQIGLTMGYPAAAGVIWHVTGRIVSPRIVYSRITTEDSRPSLPGVGDDDDDPAGTLAVSGSFGVQYTPSRRFGLFGEVGIARAHTEQSRSFPGIAVTTSVTSWSTRGAVGVILYLGS